MTRTNLSLVGAGTLFGLALSVGLWLMSYRDRCETTGHMQFPEMVGANGLTRYVPDGCQNDANGYRNAAVPEQAEIVALGDSNTWGASVGRRDSWPSVLARTTGLKVYNMSMGGWGPVEFAAALPEALALRPRLVIVALYLGNDIYNAYASFARQTPGVAFVKDSLPLPKEVAADWIADVAEEEAKDNGMIYQDAWTPQRYEARARTLPEHLRLLHVGSVLLNIHPIYRLYGVNLDEPRIAFGLAVTKQILTQMKDTATQEKARLAVAILPSKEFVYCTVFEESRTSSAWSRICRFEGQIEEEVTRHLQSIGVETISATARFREAAIAGAEIYPGIDTHTGREGTALFSEVVARLIHDGK